MERQDIAASIFTISDVLTADECRQTIALAEERGFNAAPIKAFDVEWLDQETRNNDRVMFDDIELARRIWSRIDEFVPRMLAGWPARGLNERFRFYRYAPGQRFSWHWDSSLAGANSEVSLVTFMIYLNEDYEGGETRFEDAAKSPTGGALSVVGRRGMALLFEHRLLHEGAEVTGGVKYVLRSDVMYGPAARVTSMEGMNAITSRWRYYEDFYRGRLRNEAMAAFVARIAPIAIAENMYPHNSHPWLVLSKHRGRSVYLLCNKLGSRFGLSWYKDGHPVMYEAVKDIDSARWQRIVAWLNLWDQIES